MHTGIKQVEVDKIEKIAGSKKKKKHILSGHTRTNNTCGKKKKDGLNGHSYETMYPPCRKCQQMSSMEKTINTCRVDLYTLRDKK